MTRQTVSVSILTSPFGQVGVVLTQAGVGRVALPPEPEQACADWVRRWFPDVRRLGGDPRLAQVADELLAYLAGRLKQFTVPLDLRGTPFQLEVWRAVQAIPFGEVRTYAQVATAIGRPSACRAVGAANGANPTPILIPCHRVIGSDGALTGYVGGIPLKKRLLELEGHPEHPPGTPRGHSVGQLRS